MAGNKNQAEKAKEALEAKKAADAAKAVEAANNQQSEEEKVKAAEAAKAKKEEEEKAKEAEAAKAKENEKPKADADGFLNPMQKGVTYDDFIEAMGKKSVEDYCKGKLDEPTIKWIANEVAAHKKNKEK